MQEILTRYPEKTITIMKGANFKCGDDIIQETLTNCPKDQFCTSPAGEICIYSINDAAKLTQFHPLDLLLLPDAIIPIIAFIVIFLSLGVIIGIRLKK